MSENKKVTDSEDRNLVTVKSWLLAYNPLKYDWENDDEANSFDTMIYKLQNGGAYTDCWRCINKQVKVGDRVFIIKLGKDPKGIIASGFAISDSYVDYYNDDNGDKQQKSVVDICLTKALDYRNGDIILYKSLKEKFPEQQWTPQGSGISIKSDAANWLIDFFDGNNPSAINETNDEVSDEYTIERINEFHSDSRIKIWFKPVIDALVMLGGTAERSVVHQKVIEMCNVPKSEVEKKNKSGNRTIINDIDWARNYLAYEGFIDKDTENGIWSITDLGKSVQMNEELAEKIIRKWVLIKAAQRENNSVPIIDLSPLYTKVLEKYTKDDFLKDVYMDEESYDVLSDLIRSKKNVILQGAPGVGKTYAAKRLAYSMMGVKDPERVKMIQFHQSYSYEDFIMGFRPSENGFELKRGAFYNFCKKAEIDSDNKYFFIIDEINRGNLSKIFGELFMLIENDKRGVEIQLLYSDEKFSVPENVYIIGMMNTADRSLALLDYALRRRFAFYEMRPGFDTDGFRAYRDSLGSDKFNRLINCVESLNNVIANDESLGEGFCIGHSYFCNFKEVTDKSLFAVIEFEIIPLLKEYWFDEPSKVRDWSSNLRSAVK